jgi:hypothetical protein
MGFHHGALTGGALLASRFAFRMGGIAARAG